MLELLSLAQHRQRPLYFGKGALLAMSTSPFDQQAWLDRIGYTGSLQPTLDTLYKLIFAHSHGIAYESLDIMLGRTPNLDIASLQRKMISGGRGGYCLEQNMLFREGLRSLGYNITSLQGRSCAAWQSTFRAPQFTCCSKSACLKGPIGGRGVRQPRSRIGSITARGRRAGDATRADAIR